MSQLLHHLDERLCVESDANMRAELLAQKAGYLARVGRFEEAKSIISEVRKTFGDIRDGRVTVQVMVAEGLALHFELLSAAASDRVARAHVLAVAMRDRELIGLTSAWRAHMAFEKSDWPLTGKFLSQAMEAADDDHHAALARCAVVLFNAFALCGDRRESQYWFLKGRDHALKQGDQATIDALLHSRATFGAARLRAQRCRGIVRQEEIALAKREVASARNLQNLTRIDAHSTYIDLCDARLRTIDGDYQGAIELFAALRDQGPYPEGHFSQPLVDLEIAYCHTKLGNNDVLSSTPSLQSLAWVDDLDVDDRLSAAWMLAELAKSRGGDTFGDTVGVRLNVATIDYEAWLLTLRANMIPFTSH